MAKAPTYNEIMAAISKKKFAPVYVLMGDEPYYIDRIANALEETVVDPADKDFNSFIFFGADTDIETVIASAQQLPMMAERQLVILKEAQALDRAKQRLERLEGYLNHVNRSSVLVIVYKAEALGATHKMVKAAQTCGGVVFNSPKLRDYSLKGPINDYCREKNIRINPASVEMLGEYIGNSLEALFSAIDKIVIAKGDGSEIMPADVVANIGISKSYSPFELTKAIGTRNYARCQMIARYYRNNPKIAPSPIITATLFNYFVKLLLAHTASDRSDEGLMKATGTKSAFMLREVKAAMASYNAGQCLRAISAIRHFDCASKGIGSMQNEQELLRELIFNIFTS